MNTFDRIAFTLFFWAVVWAIPANPAAVQTILNFLLMGSFAMAVAALQEYLYRPDKPAAAGKETP